MALARKLLQLDEAGKHRDARVRSRAADELAELGPSLVRAYPTLAADLRDKDRRARVGAAGKALGLGLKWAAGRALVEALNDPSPELRLSAAVALRELGPYGSQAIPALTALLEHPDADLSSAAAMALTEICTNAQLLGPLIAILESNNISDPIWRQLDVRYYAVAALNRVLDRGYPPWAAPELERGFAAIVAAVTHADPELRLVAVKTLRHAWDFPAIAFPALRLALKDQEDRDVRAAAATALCTYGKAAASMVEDLNAALADADEVVRTAAAAALRSIDSDAPPRRPPPLLNPAAGPYRVAQDFAQQRGVDSVAEKGNGESVATQPSAQAMRPIQLGERQSFAHGRSKAVEPLRRPP